MHLQWRKDLISQKVEVTWEKSFIIEIVSVSCPQSPAARPQLERKSFKILLTLQSERITPEAVIIRQNEARKLLLKKSHVPSEKKLFEAAFCKQAGMKCVRDHGRFSCAITHSSTRSLFSLSFPLFTILKLFFCSIYFFWFGNHTYLNFKTFICPP